MARPARDLGRIHARGRQGREPGVLDIQTLWQKADDAERRALVEEQLKSVTVFPDHLEVTVTATSALNFLYAEVGPKGSENVRVGGPLSTIRPEH